MLIHKTLVVLSLFLLLSCSHTSQDQTKRSIGTLIEDENIELDTLKKIFKQDKTWKKSRIEVVSFNKTLLLVGQAPTRKMKQQAGVIASKMPSIKKLHNAIKVSAPIPTVKVWNDTALFLKIRTALFSEKNYDSSKVKVVVENSEVFLMGLLTQKEAQLATHITRNISGVSKVIQLFEIIPDDTSNSSESD